MKKLNLLICLVCLLATTAKPQMYINGRHIYTQAGEQVVLRGANEMLLWSSDRTGSWVFDEIAKTGANCVRFTVGNDGDEMSGSDLAAAIQNANDAGMIAMPAVWHATCDWSGLQSAVNYWLRSDVRSAIQNNETFVLLNIANEAGDYQMTNYTQFVNSYKSAITQLRNAGYDCPLVIDGTNCGQNYDIVLDNWAELNAHDPQHKIIVSAHTYWEGTDSQKRAHYDAAVNKAVSNGAPFLFGEGPTPSGWQCNVSPYGYGMERSQQNNIGWLAWSWGLVSNGDCMNPNRYDITTNGVYGNWEASTGYDIAVGNTYSIQNTSVRPASLGGSGGGGSNDITSVSGPSSVSPGQNVTVQVGYTASTNRDIRVSFQLNESPWTVYGDGKADVSSGSGTANVSFTAGSSIPAGSNYKYQAYITTDGGGWNERLDEMLQSNVTVSSGGGGNGSVTVRARVSSGSSGTMELRIDDSTVRTWNLTNTSYANFTHTGLSGSGNVKIYFPDQSSSDLQVDYISVGGTTYQAENQAANTSVWQNSSCGGSYSEYMHCPGHIDFGTIDLSTGGGGTTDITIRARGNCGSETMVLEVGGSDVQTWTNVSSSASNYTYSGYSGGTIRVKFTNDGNDNCDRNLMVDYIVVDGTIYQTESSASRTGCGDTQWLWCNGNFDFGSILSGSGRVAEEVGERNISQDLVYEVYPNPASDFLMVSGKDSFDIKIYSTNGRQVLEKKNLTGRNQIDVSAFNKGVYFLHQNGSIGAKIYKLVIQ